ncbi:methyltransferase domain-containing protein [Planomonospora sp. ID67723]|uniref:SAM-dependent methyltransferase n=1 Tax=Planomonospora sp. ID67723 TaxID=2738134 RepID=UPI0018C43C5A|nr:class I SAM-dependent methyltransferase [Planomonospora sp. ID67723]MBG0833217.1 methyltransferase domain-containing protein [Planomonospora sp. ID67723]
MTAQDYDALIKQYEQLTDISQVILGDNLHVGYWEGADGDDSMQNATDRLTDLLISKLDVTPGQRVLDVGCGTGRPAVRLVRTRQVRVEAMDLGKHQVEQAIARVREEGLEDSITVRHGDAMDLEDYPGASFDAAWAIESLPHVPDRAHALREIAKALRPGGRLVFTICVELVPTTGDKRAFLDNYYRTFNASYPAFDSLPGLIEQAGLEVVELLEIGRHVFDKTMAAVAKGFRESADELERSVGLPTERTELMAESALRFGSMAETGYAVAVARRPVA